MKVSLTLFNKGVGVACEEGPSEQFSLFPTSSARKKRVFQKKDIIL